MQFEPGLRSQYTRVSTGGVATPRLNSSTLDGTAVERVRYSLYQSQGEAHDALKPNNTPDPARSSITYAGQVLSKTCGRNFFGSSMSS